QAVWSSVNLIADLISSLPFDGYRRTPERTKEQLDPAPSLVSSPSVVVDPINWRRQVLVSWLLRGNAVGDVVATDRVGWPTQVELLSPDVVSVRFENGKWVFQVAGKQ